MIEVLVSIAILAFGLLGLAAFQLRSQAAEFESFQRAQALELLRDMASRMQANRANAAGYVGTALGTGVADCTGTVGTVAFDRCEWNAMLKGSSEQTGSSKGGGDGRGAWLHHSGASPGHHGWRMFARDLRNICRVAGIGGHCCSVEYLWFGKLRRRRATATCFDTGCGRALDVQLRLA